jgi:excisionase family DNA binding protein
MRNSTAQAERLSTRQPAETPAIREVMDIRQAADYLGVSTDSLYRYASEGTLPGFRLGNRWRFKKSRLDLWMDEQSGGAVSSVPPARAVAAGKKPVKSAR